MRAFTIALLAVASRGCAALAPGDYYASLMLLTGPLELICYWLYLPDHNLKRPGAPWFCAALAARTACCVVLRDRAGLLGGAPMLGAFIVVAIGSLVRSRNNLPPREPVRLPTALRFPALLLDQPWVYFLSLSFMGAGLQGVAHEVTGQGHPQPADGRGLQAAHRRLLSRAHFAEPASFLVWAVRGDGPALPVRRGRAVAAGAGAARQRRRCRVI